MQYHACRYEGVLRGLEDDIEYSVSVVLVGGPALRYPAAGAVPVVLMPRWSTLL